MRKYIGEATNVLRENGGRTYGRVESFVRMAAGRMSVGLASRLGLAYAPLLVIREIRGDGWRIKRQ